MSGSLNEEIRVLLRVMTREVKTEIGKYKSNRWQSFLSTIQEKYDRLEKAFWSHLSRVYKPKSLPFSKLDSGEEIVSGKHEIVDELYRFYEEQFKTTETNHADPDDLEIEQEYNTLLNNLRSSDERIEKANTFEITKYIKKLKSKKSSGFDLISNYMIKLLPPSYISCLANYFNVWLGEHRYPKE
ncbi:unnamed protein product [Rotaria sp. Silwood2]|nr:unnamed protein product [Rotaria sp. Silwood2]CAF4286048.1 unnamed protein product [Rotaria sp. Silwood2]